MFCIESAYNAADQKSSLTYPGGAAGQLGEVVSYGYDAVGQLVSVSGLGGVQYMSSATYDAQGRMTQLVNEAGANGLTRQWVYDPATLRLSTIRAGTAGPFDNLQALSYSYDAAGNVTSVTDATNGGQVQSFGYDWLDRLTSATTNGMGVGQYSHTYQYNAIGNITSYAGNAYTYGSQPHAVTAAFGNSYAYDANGNQTSRTIGGVTYTFAYDYENRLTAIAGGSVTASFIYDAEGNRVKGTVNGVTTVYVAGLYEWQNGATTLYYEGGAMRRTGYAGDNGVFYLLNDHLVSTSVLVNQNGTVNSRNYFFPFGGNRSGAGFSALTTKRFTGQYHESSLPGGEGSSDYGARWYDAQLGRFLSADTIVPNPGDPQAFNRYSYVLNNPLRYIDPSGRLPMFTPGNGGGTRPPCTRGSGCTVTVPIVQDCAQNRCRHPQVSASIRFYAYTYGIPEDLLGATLMVEAIDDQQWLGRAADFVNSMSVGMYKVGSRSLGKPSLNTESAAVSYTVGSGMLWTMDAVERLHGSPGVGANNIQFTTDGNIRYAAAHLRQLADLRTDKTGPHIGRLTDTDMAIIFGAYRAGVESFGDTREFVTQQTPGATQGPLFLTRLEQYRGR